MVLVLLVVVLGLRRGLVVVETLLQSLVIRLWR